MGDARMNGIRAVLARADEAKVLGINVGQEGCSDWVEYVRYLLADNAKLTAALEAVRPLVNAERRQLLRAQMQAWLAGTGEGEGE